MRMTINPLFDDSPWTLTPPCYCPDCTIARRKSIADYMGMLEDVSLTIIYNRWPPAPPTKNLPAKRKWIARRNRIIVDGKTTYLLGWELISPSGRIRWFISREVLAFMAPHARLEEFAAWTYDILSSIGAELIS